MANRGPAAYPGVGSQRAPPTHYSMSTTGAVVDGTEARSITSLRMVCPIVLASAWRSVVLILVRSSADIVVVCPMGTTLVGLDADMGIVDLNVAMSVPPCFSQISGKEK